MNTHTPAPWQVWKFDEQSVAVGPVAGGLAVAQIVTTNAHGIPTAQTEQTGQANAHLVAAAPDLFAALDDLLSYLEGYDHDYPEAAGYFDRARTALAKAEGVKA